MTLSNVFFEIVIDIFYITYIDSTDDLESVIKLTRIVYVKIKIFDKRLVRLISEIHNVSNYRQYNHVTNTAAVTGSFSTFIFHC